MQEWQYIKGPLDKNPQHRHGAVIRQDKTRRPIPSRKKLAGLERAGNQKGSTPYYRKHGNT